MQTHSIAVIGAGYVGLTLGAGLSTLGHSVTVVDRIAARVETINSGKSPLFEEGLASAISEGVNAGLLSASRDLAATVKNAGTVFLAVGTPMSDTGHADISDLEKAFDEVVDASTDDTVIVIKSTVPVGTYRLLQDRATRDVRLVANPEFLRQGTALNDMLHPERIVFGADDINDSRHVAELFTTVVDGGAELIMISPESAALVKYASNAFLATKLSFINEMADLAELSGADIDEVAGALGLDHRIGSQYLNPGPGFGGSCLPKDTAALLATSGRFGATAHVVSAATRVNRDRIGLMVDKIARQFDGGLRDRHLVVLGITFKAGTDDLRDSPAIPIIEELHARGADVTLYDPQGMQAAITRFPWINTAATLEDAIAAADNAVIATEWPEFGKLDPASLPLDHLIDLRNMYQPSDFDGTSTTYVSIGRRTSVPE